jgi:uncharacterized protein YbjQ (UPF0145 family)
MLLLTQYPAAPFACSGALRSRAGRSVRSERKNYMDEIPILTTPLVEGSTVAEYKGLATARNVRAVNVIRDVFTAFRDFFGGRSESYQDVMADMKREVLAEVRSRAEHLGANAVIGFTLDFDNVGSKNKSLLLAHGKGTAVVSS